jgi:serine/threonine protein kinase
LNEARALARMRHPNIVTVFGIAEDQGRVGMWMECVPGISLAREIERVGALPAHRVAQIGLQICSALEALDAAGLVHRDIKPANILLEGEDRVVLTDFGLGWRAELNGDVVPKSSGTPLFISFKRGSLTPAQEADVARALTTAAQPHPTGEPLDWFERLQPRNWKLMGEPVQYDWDAPQSASQSK